MLRGAAHYLSPLGGLENFGCVTIKFTYSPYNILMIPPHWQLIGGLFSTVPLKTLLVTTDHSKLKLLVSCRRNKSTGPSLAWGKTRLDFRLFFLKKRLIDKIIGLGKIKPANIRWVNCGKKHFNEVNSFHVNCEWRFFKWYKVTYRDITVTGRVTSEVTIIPASYLRC